MSQFSEPQPKQAVFLEVLILAGNERRRCNHGTSDSAAAFSLERQSNWAPVAATCLNL
jgi:hypothetical protein